MVVCQYRYSTARSTVVCGRLGDSAESGQQEFIINLFPYDSLGLAELCD